MIILPMLESDPMSATEKVSVTIGRGELGQAKRLASKLGVSLSGFITDAVRERVREQERLEAALEVLASFPSRDRASPADARELLERWHSEPGSPAARPKAPRKKRAPGARKR